MCISLPLERERRNAREQRRQATESENYYSGKAAVNLFTLDHIRRNLEDDICTAYNLEREKPLGRDDVILVFKFYCL